MTGRRILSFVLALGAAGLVAPPAFAQESASGRASIMKVRASPFGSSVLVTVGCAANGADCQGELRGSAKVGGRTVRLGSVPFSVFTGDSSTLQLKLPKRVKDRLRSTGRLAVVVTVTDGSGEPAVTVRTTVRVAKKKHRA